MIIHYPVVGAQHYAAMHNRRVARSIRTCPAEWGRALHFFYGGGGNINWSSTGWWWLEHDWMILFYFSRNSWDYMIIPSDELIFFRGVQTTNQAKLGCHSMPRKSRYILSSGGRRDPRSVWGTRIFPIFMCIYIYIYIFYYLMGSRLELHSQSFSTI